MPKVRLDVALPFSTDRLLFCEVPRMLKSCCSACRSGIAADAAAPSTRILSVTVSPSCT